MRLFVAVDVPADVRAGVDRACEPLRAEAPALRWVPTVRWHLTLVFLGSVEHAAVDRVRAAVATGCLMTAPFTLALDGRLGTFRRAVLWAGIHASEPLVTLAQLLRSTLGAVVALPDAERPFRAHLTLARAPRGASVPRTVADVRVPARSWTVSQAVLYASRAGAGGPRYEEHGRWSLAGGGVAAPGA